MNPLDWLLASVLPVRRAQAQRRANAYEFELMVQLSGFVDPRLAADRAPDARAKHSEEKRA